LSGSARGHRVPTSRDVARLAGVSQATVSRVLNGNDRVSEETAQRVHEALRSTGYTPNLAAATLRTRRTGTLGLVIERITNPFYPELIESLGRELARRDLRLALWNTSIAAGDRAATQAIYSRGIDGLIFTAATAQSNALRLAIEREAPVVLVNRSVPDLACDQVECDNEAAGAEMARYFAHHGHAVVGLIGGPQGASTARGRVKGFTETASALGLKLEVVDGGAEFSHDWGYTAFESLFDRAETKPTALFCGNDLTAFGAMDAARDRGLDIPKDLWVAGFDGIAMSAWPSYDLTTARLPLDQMIEAAVDLLLSRVADSTRPATHLRFSSELVIRGSTAHAALPPPA
jgi:LacI family transcriptional regulator